MDNIRIISLDYYTVFVTTCIVSSNSVQTNYHPMSGKLVNLSFSSIIVDVRQTTKKTKSLCSL